MKKAVVTGVGKGIGLAVAQRLAQAGYGIVGCAGQKSIDTLRPLYPDWQLHVCDVSHRAQVEAFAAAALATDGPVEIVVNNAGRFIPGSLLAEPEGALDAQLATNLASVYHLTRALVPSMIEQGYGTVVNLCSTASITPYVNGGSYCISKFALLGLTRVLREELKDKNIRVIAVLPGAVLTASWEGTPLPPDRFMLPEDIAEVIATACALRQGTVIEEILLRPMKGDIGADEF
jgi:NAD(P)-dependent dehydrogenase (short-subunit alcohol dehydrogenase family)